MGHPLRKVQGTWLLFWLTAGCMATQGLFGFDSGVYSGVSASANWLELFPQVKSANVAGITSACFSLGAVFGCLLTFGYLGDKVGRRYSIVIGMCINIVGVILQISAFSLSQEIVGRIVNGFGIGITSSTAPTYQAECSPLRVRGRLVVLGSLTNTFGVTLAGWMNFGFFYLQGAIVWRLPLALQFIFIFVALSIIPFMPESPRFLFVRDRQEEGLEVLARFMGKSIDNPEVLAERDSILAAIREEQEHKVPLKDLITCKDKTQNLRRIVLGANTMLMQQLSGVNAIGYYMVTLLTSIGFSGTQSRLFTAGYNTMYLFSAFCCLAIIDRAGRRPMLFGGSIAMMICYILASVSLRVSETTTDKDLMHSMQALTVSAFFLYYFSYGMSYAKLPWVILSEIQSLGYRTQGAAIATCTNWLFSFVTVFYFPAAIQNLGWGTFILFACFCASYLPISYLFYPETMNRTLEDIDEIFTVSHSWFVFGNNTLTSRKRPQAFIDAERERIEKMGLVREQEQFGLKSAHDIVQSEHIEHRDV